MEGHIFYSAFAMFLGLLGTSLFHLAKGLQKKGIDALSKYQRGSKKNGELKAYIAGLTLNAALPLLILVAGKFAPVSYFTSMFGMGLLVLMFFSHRVLGEPVTASKYAGSAILICGTIIVCMENLMAKPMIMDMKAGPLMVFGALYMAVSILLLNPFRKNSSAFFLSLSFGFFTGFTAAMDPVLKSLSQHFGGGCPFLPGTWTAWLILAGSFVSGMLSFLMTQVGFAKGGRASLMIPIHNSLIVLIPIIIEFISIPEKRLSVMTCSGGALIVSGLFIIQTGGRFFRRDAPSGTPGND